MRYGEGVVDIDVAKRRQLFGELSIIFIFARLKPEILQKDNLAILKPGHTLLHNRSHAILQEEDLFLQKIRKNLDDRLE